MNQVKLTHELSTITNLWIVGREFEDDAGYLSITSEILESWKRKVGTSFTKCDDIVRHELKLFSTNEDPKRWVELNSFNASKLAHPYTNDA